MAQGFIGNSDFRRAGFGAILSIILSLQSRCKIMSISKNATKPTGFWSILFYLLMSSMSCRHTIYVTFLQAPPVVLNARGAGKFVIISSILSSQSRISFIKWYKNQLIFNDFCLWGNWNLLNTHIDRISTTQHVNPENVVILQVLEPFCIFDDSAGEGSGGPFWGIITHVYLKSHRFQKMLQKPIDF